MLQVDSPTMFLGDSPTMFQGDSPAMFQSDSFMMCPSDSCTCSQGDPRDRLFLGVDRGRSVPVASAGLLHPRPGDPQVEIVRMNVSPQYRRRGLARAMLRHLLAHLSKQGYSKEHVYLHTSNLQVRNL